MKVKGMLSMKNPKVVLKFMIIKVSKYVMNKSLGKNKGKVKGLQMLEVM